jgi:hypothetical protein
MRMLRAARDAGVRRVVLTSSFAAIGYGHPVRSVMQLALLAPPLVEALLDGRRRLRGGVVELLNGSLPLSWQQQRTNLCEVLPERRECLDPATDTTIRTPRENLENWPHRGQFPDRFARL